MNEITTEFPEKALLLNRFNGNTYRMLLYSDSYSYPARTTLPIKRNGKVLGATLECHVSHAFFLKGPYVRKIVEISSKDGFSQGTLSMEVDGCKVISEVPLGEIEEEAKSLPIKFASAKQELFFAMPYAAIQDPLNTALGLFLPNKSEVMVCVEGIEETDEIEIGLVMAEYKSK